MTRNSYFLKVVRRENVLANWVLDFFITFSSWFRLLIEVVIRRNMGERYFKLSSAITVAAMLFFYPIAAERFPFLTATRAIHGHHGPSLLTQYWSWYLFLIVFAASAFLRWREIKNAPSVFDGGRCSTYTGDIHPFFFRLHPFGKKVTTRQVECWFEPSMVFFIGYWLNVFGQRIGILLMIASVFYALSYVGMYRKGDTYILDILDSQIFGQGMENALVNDNPNNGRGVRIRGRRPAKKESRKNLADAINAQSGDVSYVS